MARSWDLALFVLLLAIVSYSPAGTMYRQHKRRATSVFDKQRISSKCMNKTRACDISFEPRDGVGQYVCVFNNKMCTKACTLKCPKSARHSKWVLDSKHLKREVYSCQGGQWKLKNGLRTFCKAKWTVNEVKQNLHHTEDLNYLVQALMNTSYFYLGMSTFYDRADVSLPGFSKYMSDLWSSDMALAKDVLQYVNRRGGYISLYDLPRPSSHEMLLMERSNRPGLSGMALALQANKDISSHVQELHGMAAKPGNNNDPHLKFYLEDNILASKVDKVKEISDHVTRLKDFPDEDYTLGEYVLDTELGS